MVKPSALARQHTDKREYSIGLRELLILFCSSDSMTMNVDRPTIPCFVWQYDTMSIPVEQAAQVRVWLSSHGFRKMECHDEQPEYWFRGECGVRLSHGDEDYGIDILHAAGSANWRTLAEVVSFRSAWSAAATLPPIELATLSRPEPDAAVTAPRRNLGSWLYEKAKPTAYGIKVFLQMTVGLGAVLDIAWHVEQSVSMHHGQDPFAPSIAKSVLVIASALAVAAAIELAYTLFTPGPDEALEPLMLGLSSGILFLITENADKGLSPAVQFSAVLLGSIALGVLFMIRNRFIGDDDE